MVKPGPQDQDSRAGYPEQNRTGQPEQDSHDGQSRQYCLDMTARQDCRDGTAMIGTDRIEQHDRKGRKDLET
jgi:hypothetical protein